MQTLSQQLMRQGKKEGIKEGIKEGKNEEKRETARLMLMDDCPIEFIMKYTGLNEKEIKSLLN